MLLGSCAFNALMGLTTAMPLSCVITHYNYKVLSVVWLQAIAQEAAGQLRSLACRFMMAPSGLRCNLLTLFMRCI
jgi:hypothetical protein